MKIIIFLVIIAYINAEKLRFDHHQLFGLTLETVDQVNAIRQIEESSEDGYLFWNSIIIGRAVDIMVSPHKLSEFKNKLEKLSVKYTLRIENIQE